MWVKYVDECWRSIWACFFWDPDGDTPGAFGVWAKVGNPFFQTHVIRYQKNFCTLIAPLVENSYLSQCWARVESPCIVLLMPSVSFWAVDISGFLVYEDITLREESSTKAIPTVRTIIFMHTEVNIAMESSGSIEFTIRQKHNKQNNGPRVEPWPGPNSGVWGVLV